LPGYLNRLLLGIHNSGDFTIAFTSHCPATIMSNYVLIFSFAHRFYQLVFNFITKLNRHYVTSLRSEKQLWTINMLTGGTWKSTAA
jgi:hypothetical protein